MRIEVRPFLLLSMLLSVACRRETSPPAPGPAIGPSASASAPSGPALRASDSAAGVALSCTLHRRGDLLVFDYEVTSHDASDVYVMDAEPAIDPVTRRATADRSAAVISLGGDGKAQVLKGIAPLPTDRDVNVGIIPLGAKLTSGGTLTRSLSLPLPLMERGPYQPVLPVDAHDRVGASAVVLTVEILRSSVDGFGAEPAPYAPDLFIVHGKYTRGQVERLSCTFATRIDVLRRR